MNEIGTDRRRYCKSNTVFLKKDQNCDELNETFLATDKESSKMPNCEKHRTRNLIVKC